MTLTQLKYYVEIVNEGSFTRAADKLFVSQSALSKSVKQLEEEFQIQLLNRTGKDFTLSESGHIFYDYAIRILRYYDEQTETLFRELQSANRNLRIGVPPTAGAIYFYKVFNDYRMKYPGISLDIDEIPSKAITESVLSGDLDLGIVIEPFYDRSFVKRPVYSSEAVLLVSGNHRLAHRDKVALSEIRDEKFLSISKDYMFYDVVMDKCHEAGFVPDITFESYQWEWIFEMVAADQGVSILPKPLVDKFNNFRVHQIHLMEPEFPWSLDIIYRKDKFITVPMQYFLDLSAKG